MKKGTSQTSKINARENKEKSERNWARENATEDKKKTEQDVHGGRRKRRKQDKEKVEKTL